MPDSNFNDILSKNIKRYMFLANLNQSELAKKVGVSTAIVSEWLSGKKVPRMDKVDKMCRIFGCTRDDLVTETGGKSPVAQAINEDTLLVAEYKNEITAMDNNRVLRDIVREADGLPSSVLYPILDMIRAYKTARED